MPRRKKLPVIPDYEGEGRHPDSLLVQKTNPLLTLSDTDMTLPELKILDVYLSRIDSHNPEKRFIRLEKGQIEKLLGVTQIKPHDLEKRIDNLFQTITIRDERKSKGFTKVALFEKAVCYQDDDGLWQVDLGASWSAMEYIFNPETIGYLRYRLANVINLTSRYSYILYLYLEHERYRKSWEIELDELKAMLRCNAETYSQFFRFNGLVLKKCYNELTEKTTLRFTYSPVRRGRAVRAIRFTVETTPQLPTPMEQLTIAEIEDRPDDQIEFLRSACIPSGTARPEFSREEMEQLFEVLVMVDDNILPYPKDIPNDMEIRRYHYLRQKYTAMNCADTKKTIKHRFSYLLKMIKKDAGIFVGQGVQ